MLWLPPHPVQSWQQPLVAWERKEFAVGLPDMIYRIGWNKFRQLVPLLTNKDISLTVRARLYSSCVRSSTVKPLILAALNFGV